MTRELAIKIISGEVLGTRKKTDEACGMAIKALSTQPDVPDISVGKWIEDDDEIISGHCSVCGWNAILYETDVVGMPYCPNCGARMVEGGQDETD